MCPIRWTRKKIAALGIVVALFSITASSTIAYFTAEDTARNVITSGGIDVSVIEMHRMADGTLQPYPNEPIQIMPGSEVSKIVSARNNEQEAWVRMGYTIDVYTENGSVLQKTPTELSLAITIDSDDEHWAEADGWWYYKTPLKSGESTEPLFESVRFSAEEMGNEYQNCTVEINVIAEAVQLANNPLPESGKYEEIPGWPEVPAEDQDILE